MTEHLSTNALGHIRAELAASAILAGRYAPSMALSGEAHDWVAALLDVAEAAQECRDLHMHPGCADVEAALEKLPQVYANEEDR